MADKVFPEGISIFKAEEGRPAFVKGKVSIDAKKLQEWLQTHPEYRDEKGFVKLDVLESSKEGNKWYLGVDTYKKEAAPVDDVPTIDDSGVPF